MNRINGLSDSDFDLILRYIDEDLEAVEALRFDARLGDEPKLAAALEQMLAMESLAQSPGPTSKFEGRSKQLDDRPAWRQRGWVRAVLVAAALLLTSYLVLRLQTEDGPDVAPTRQVAVLRTEATVERYWSEFGLDPDLMPPSLRGDPSSQHILEDIEAYALARERELVAHELMRPTETGLDDVVAPRFKLAFGPAADCSVVVVAIPANGQAKRVYPNDSRGDYLPNRFLASESYVLPRPSYALRADLDGSVQSFDGGFIRRLGVTRLVTIVASRRDAVERALLDELDLFLESLEPVPKSGLGEAHQQIVLWLADRSFSSQRLDVVGD